MYRCDVAARRIGGRAVDHRHAERAEREDREQQRPVDVVVEASFEHVTCSRFRGTVPRLTGVASGSAESEVRVVSSSAAAAAAALPSSRRTCRARDARPARRSAPCIAVLERRRRRQSAGCRAARRTRTSRCRADPWSVLPAAAAALVRDHLRRAGLAGDVVALDAARCAPVPAPFTTIHRPSRIACSFSGIERRPSTAAPAAAPASTRCRRRPP